MTTWQVGMTTLAGIIIVSALWGWLEECRVDRVRRSVCQCRSCDGHWPDESDGFPEWVNDRDWDLAAKLELYETDQ